MNNCAYTHLRFCPRRCREQPGRGAKMIDRRLPRSPLRISGSLPRGRHWSNVVRRLCKYCTCRPLASTSFVHSKSNQAVQPRKKSRAVSSIFFPVSRRRHRRTPPTGSSQSGNPNVPSQRRGRGCLLYLPVSNSRSIIAQHRKART